MQHVLQAGLTAGMSATEGIHSNKPSRVGEDFDGLAAVLPQDFVPTAETKVTMRGKKENVQAPWLSIGAWPWGDKATWQWSPEELSGVKEGWEIMRKAGMNWIDTAQAYGTGDSERICKDLFQGLKREDYVIQTKW